MVYEGSIVRYDPAVPMSARDYSLERALVTSAARMATRAELLSLTVRSAIQIASTIYYEVQVAQKTFRIQLEAAIATTQMEKAYQVGERMDHLIRRAESQFSDPELRDIYQNAVRQCYRATMEGWANRR
ncbi:hypothetical protein AB0F72_29640 [Actinoplanes sp. NPDC023936]|uniref:hypothetical protein n=1 Tax=Actinoplanes sp. NPDC023936 TaxID=3154910 RepID=UPI0033FD081A